MTPPLPEGAYESLRTLGLDADLTPRFARIDEADAPHVLARHVATAIERVPRQEADAGRRLELVNDLLSRVAEHDEQVARRSSGRWTVRPAHAAISPDIFLWKDGRLRWTHRSAGIDRTRRLGTRLGF
jgi:hypothetical protein